jgi:polyisoprenoid-binding protein YceI
MTFAFILLTFKKLAFMSYVIGILFSSLLYLSSPTSITSNPAEDDINGKWIINPEDSEIKFNIQAMMLFNVEGIFTIESGSIIIKDRLLSAEVDLRIDVATVNTGNKKRDEHLKQEEFFHVDKYPYITFSSKKITRQTGDTYSVEGDLTIKDVTKEIVVAVQYKGLNEKGQIMFSGNKNINRRDYNIYYSGRGVNDTAEVYFKIIADKE